MKLLCLLPALGLLGGCTSSKSPALLMPSRDAPRVAINKPTRLGGPTPATSIMAARRSPGWLIQQSDQNVGRMLRRWGKDEGWTVFWTDAPEVLITGDGKLETPDFLSAAELVITDVKAKGYPIRAKAYADRVLEVRTEEIK